MFEFLENCHFSHFEMSISQETLQTDFLANNLQFFSPKVSKEALLMEH